MYEAHFGFSGSPFQLNPDPAFYFNSRGHGHALAYLRYGVAQGEGFIVVTGEIGAGKTTLLRALLGELDRAQVVAAQIVSTQLESGDLLQAIITAFGIPTNGAGKASLIATLEAFLMTLATQGRRALLVIDEAQNLEIRAIEELRMLSNFQLGTQSLLQSFLVGQPELRKKLESPEMEQLRQRVTASCHLGPLGLEETQAYIEHRLRRVGWTDRPSFAQTAFDQIYRWTGGVPRRINRLCNRLLLAAFLEGRTGIDAQLVEVTAKELRQEIGEGAFEPVDLPARVEPQQAAPEATVEVTTPVDHAAEPVLVPEAAIEAIEPSSSTSPPDSGIPAIVLEPQLPEVLSAQQPIEDLTSLTAGGPELGTSAQAEEPRQLVTEEAQGARPPQASSELSVDDETPAKIAVLTEAQPSSPAALPVPVKWVGRLDVLEGVPVVLCLADSSSAALKFALIAKAWASKPNSPRLVLVNAAEESSGWPWEEMNSLLPGFDVSVHLCLSQGALEDIGGDLFPRFATVIDELAPRGVLVLGESDAMLGCALVARKRDIPVLRLEAGLESDEDILNATLIEQCADAVFTPSTADTLHRLHRRGVPAARVFALPGSLSADLINTVLPAMTTPYGAFLRHRLPIFLGPRWSAEVDGTAYALISVSLEAMDAEQVGAMMAVMLELTAVPKLVWLTNESTRDQVRRWQTTTPHLADEVFVIEENLPRAALDQRNSARILCCDIQSLPDQLSIMRGAVCVIAEPGHVLAMASRELGTPQMVLHDGRLHISAPGQESVVRPWGVLALNESLRAFVAREETTAAPAPVAQDGCMAAMVLAARLHRWMEGRLRSGWTDRPTGLVVLPGALKQPSPNAAAA